MPRFIDGVVLMPRFIDGVVLMPRFIDGVVLHATQVKKKTRKENRFTHSFDAEARCGLWRRALRHPLVRTEGVVRLPLALGDVVTQEAVRFIELGVRPEASQGLELLSLGGVECTLVLQERGMA
jgi:hypothetical protein